MEGKLLHTPEGVRDIYNHECKRKLSLQEKIHQVFANYGFHDIETPTFEYFDIFSREVGTTPSKDLFKFFDREGNTLVLRPDFTPSIVRSAAKYYEDTTLPVRLCYKGNAFINESAVYQGRLKETTQMGAELFGDTSVESEAEMIALAVDSLKASGLTKFQVEIGQVEFFKGLLEEAGLDEEEGETLRKLISNKSFFGIEEMLSSKFIDKDLKDVFLRLSEAFGTIEIIYEAKNWTKNARANAAIDRLIQLYELLRAYGCDEYVSFDLGMLSKYKYYTGIIFKAYTYGMGEAIATGGRYDNLMQYFGKASPAIGFVLFIDHLLTAVQRQKMPLPAMAEQTLIVYNEKAYIAAITLAKDLRGQNKPVALMKDGNEDAASIGIIGAAGEMDYTHVIYIDENGQVQEGK